MTDQHPITPPPELIEQWREETCPFFHLGGINDLATQAARWGADQELEACIEWLDHYVPRYAEWSANFRAARRPKPPTLKEQALALVSHNFSDQPCLSEEGYAIIRRALEQLDD
jgi:hypothetical protein